MEKLLNIKEAAEFLNVSEMTIRRWTNGGKLPCFRENAIRIPRRQMHAIDVDLDPTETAGGFWTPTPPEA